MEQRNTDNLAKTANVMIFVIFLFVALFLSLGRIDRAQRERALDNCARISRFEAQIDGGKSKATYPIADVYAKCVKDKGY